jgi:predicted nucleotidyltransferase
VFTVAERDAIRRRLLERARADPRIAACALVGSSARGEDRWSDLDVALGVAQGATVEEVLAAWTGYLDVDLGATVLFDVSVRTTTYRVFLLPGNLQVDLSFTPSDGFAPLGPRFELVFGTAGPAVFPAPRPVEDVVGLAVHHAVRARVSIERGRPWQAEYWVSALRDEALVLACRLHGLEEDHGRGVDRLPADVLALASCALVRSDSRPDLLRALSAAVELLLLTSSAAGGGAVRLEGRLRELTRRTLV